jgi:hypothetical protein
MAVAQRFDINAARQEALAAEKAKKNKMIVSYVLLGVVLLLLLIAGKFGYDMLKARKERLEQEARQAELAEQARIKKERIKREKEMKERALEQQRKMQEREEQRRKMQQEQEEKRKLAQEERERKRREQEEKRIADRQEAMRQVELRKYGLESLKRFSFKLNQYITVQKDIAKTVLVSCEDELWLNLAAKLKSRASNDFYALLPIEGEKPLLPNKFYEEEVISEKTAKLDELKFSITVRTQNIGEKQDMISLYTLTYEEGLKLVDQAYAIVEDGAVTGWRVPFTYSSSMTYYVMTLRNAAAIQRRYFADLRSIVREARVKNADNIKITAMRREYFNTFPQKVLDSMNLPDKDEEKMVMVHRQDEKEKARQERLERLKSQNRLRSSSTTRSNPYNTSTRSTNVRRLGK